MWVANGAFARAPEAAPAHPGEASPAPTRDALSLTPIASSAKSSVAAPAPEESVPDAAPKPKRHALLIGIGQATYKGIQQVPLPQCVIDAQTLAATLRPRGYSCDVIADGEKIEPLAATIRDEVAAASGLATENDQLLVYISTHGDVIDGKSVIIANDGAVDIDWIKRHMAASKAAVKILMLDCCRNNKGFERSATEVRDVHCIMACRPDQLSQVGQSGMSVFTEAMVDALVECRADRVKDGKIELDELMYFLEREVPIRAAKADKEKPQNPTRTVVDPKAVTPVFADCTLHDQLTFGPRTYAKTPPPAARTSLALTDLTLLQVQRGMTVDQVTKAIGGEWSQAPELDASGAGMALLEGKPSPQDVLVVRFVESKVALAHVLYRDLCKEEYAPLKVRGALRNLIGEEPLAELSVHLKDLAPEDIIKKLGCPDAALLPTGQFSDQDGELRYPEAPRPAQMMVIRIKAGLFDSVDIAVIK